MSSMNESVIIIKHFCYKCQKEIDMLTNQHTCGDCGTGFIEEIIKTPPKKQIKKKEPITDEIIKEIDKCSASPHQKSPEKPECCICLQEMDSNKEAIVQLVCQHSFHKQCVKNWFQTAKNNCPLCRGSVDVPSVITPVSNIRIGGRHTLFRSRAVRVRGTRPVIVRSRSPISETSLPNHTVLNGRNVRNLIRGIENRGTDDREIRYLRQYYRDIMGSPVSADDGRRSPEYAWIFPPDFGEPSSSSSASN